MKFITQIWIEILGKKRETDVFNGLKNTNIHPVYKPTVGQF